MTVPPTGIVTVSARFPEPLAVHVEPPAATQVQAAPLSEAGRVSATVAPVARDGPALVTTIEYVTEVPAVAVAAPSVLVICRSLEATSVVLSVAVLLAGVVSVKVTGAVTVAVFDSVPEAVDEIVALIV